LLEKKQEKRTTREVITVYVFSVKQNKERAHRTTKNSHTGYHSVSSYQRLPHAPCQSNEDCELLIFYELSYRATHAASCGGLYKGVSLGDGSWALCGFCRILKSSRTESYLPGASDWARGLGSIRPKTFCRGEERPRPRVCKR
jgi:hypothetical protein